MRARHPLPIRPAPLRIGVAGLGTVGAGVLRLLHGNAALVAARAGRPIQVTAVSARDRARDRGVATCRAAPGTTTRPALPPVRTSTSSWS